MQVVLRLHGDEHGSAASCWAVVKLTPETAQRLLGYIETLRGIKAQVPETLRLVLFDYTPDYVTDIFIEKHLAEAHEDLYNTIEMTAQAIVLPQEIVLDAEDDPDNDDRWDYAHVNVNDDGVFWTVCLKHTSVEIDTDEIPALLLRNAAGFDTKCQRCSSALYGGRCTDVTCPYSDRYQNAAWTEG